MRKVSVFKHNIIAGTLIEADEQPNLFECNEAYKVMPISLTIPVNKQYSEFDRFPPFFDGLLPESVM